MLTINLVIVMIDNTTFIAYQVQRHNVSWISSK